MKEKKLMNTAKVITITVGSLQENCYLLVRNHQAIIIDPGDELEKIVKQLGDLEVVGILVTHHHFDHIGALSSLENKYKIKHNEKIPQFTYEVIPTPGHTEDSLTFYFPQEKIMFTGDFLFQNAIGRTDLGGNPISMRQSLENIANYPDDIVIYPGHGATSTLGQEKANFNFYNKMLH